MRMPLKIKAILLIVMLSLLIGVAGIIVYNRGIDSIIIEEDGTRALDIAGAAAETLDAEKVKRLRDAILAIYENEKTIVLSDQWDTPEFEEYISHYSAIEQSEEFISLREQLRRVQDVTNVDCLYVIWFDVVRKQYVYLVDAAYEGACPPGCVDPLYVDDEEYIASLDKYAPPNVTHTEEYGYLMTTAMPVRTEDGAIVGYAAVDLSMNEIVEHERQIMGTVLVVFGIVTVLVTVIGIVVVDLTIVRHINKLSETAKQYSANNLNFTNLEIHTGDEIEVLADSMKRMERDIREYYQGLLEASSSLREARESAEVYEREANIDPLTGLRNRRAYDAAVVNLDSSTEPYAIVMFDLNDLKTINDRYGHEKGNAAIQNLARLICDVFKHSPVYRIGGDEFVAILTRRDLDARETLIWQFREAAGSAREFDESRPWENPGAACGYAVYDPQIDSGAAGVFKRADKNMYENKTSSKADRP